ncbi:MAG: hypothetical protein IT305_07805, partial [Chloroflexi bacterium]|nr:hypothetical protein [Chloroflexota bacterium]
MAVRYSSAERISARQNVRGQTVWDGQLLGPQGEVRGRVELTADGRGRANQTTLVGNAYGADDELLATVRVNLETEDQARPVGGRGLNDTAVSVAYGGQQLRTVTLLVDGTGKPNPQTGPPARITPDPRPSPEVRPSPQPPTASPPTASPPARLPGPVRDAPPVASPAATATTLPPPTATTPPASGAPAEGAPSLQLDGRQLRLATLELTNAKPRLLPSTTALSGQVLALSGKPLAEVTLTVNGVSAQTDRTGRFLLAPLSDGHQVVTIDVRTANRLKRQFGVFQAGVDLVKGQVNVLPYTIWMPALDTERTVQIPTTTTSEVVLTTPHIPGLEVHIPAAAQIRDADGHPVHEIGITAIPIDQTPFPIPHFVEVPVYFTVQPGSAVVDAASGAWVVYPNYSNLPAGARADFWQYDPKKRGWFIYGQGTVTADGKQVVPDPNVRIFNFTGFMFNGHGWSMPTIGGVIDNWTKDGDPVDLETGLFILEKTDLALPDTTPLALTRTYRPNDSQSRPFGIGATHPYEIFLWTTMANGGWQDYTKVWLVLPDGARVYYPRISPGTGWTDAVFENTDAPTAYYKSRITYRSWGWDLTFQDGTVYRFGDNAPLQWMRDRYGNLTRILRTGTDAYGNGTGQITRVISPNGRWIAFTYGTGNRVSQAMDNLGRTVGYTYDGSGRLTKVTDPAGGETEYTYDA